MDALFSIENLTKIYEINEIKVTALHHVNLKIFPKEFIVILGPSGSGKSTLLNILGGLDVATHGKVFFKDENLTHYSENLLTNYRRQSIGFVFQFYNLIPTLTALENVELGSSVIKDAMSPKEALKWMDLSHRLHHFPSELSGGEQQRVAIARAIAKKPPVLLCDEPTGALDCQTGKIVLRALKLINEKLGATVIIITHNTAIGQMADRIIHIADGQIQNIETPPHKLNPEALIW